VKLGPGVVRTLAVTAICAAPTDAAERGLPKAQELFQQNRWADARAEIRANGGSIPEKDRGRATFLVGRSYVNEAEFYRAVRQWGTEVGLDYLGELGSTKENQGVAWIPLFSGLYRLESGDERNAERALATSAASPALPEPWKSLARRRAAVASYRLAKPSAADTLTRDSSYEGSYWRIVLPGLPRPGELPAGKTRGPEPLLGACVLFRAGENKLAEAMLYGLDPDRPDVEDNRDPKKLLRFFDPVVAAALERIAWERAVAALRPLAQSASGPESNLAAYYTGLSLHFLGAGSEASAFLAKADPGAVGREIHGRAQILVAAASGKTSAELASLWEATQADPEAVLLWKAVEAKPTKPFSGALDEKLADLPRSLPPRPSGSVVGQWGLIRLRSGADPGEVLQALSAHRNNANKNKLESNAPLLLLALSAANYRNSNYAQALETLFELSKTFKGMRALLWNLQGVYAARHEAAGEARISR